uniref:Uncharacterized protein n=1 Tax=Peronospora matthiolae TaxID=2874970 RepID=A0AAV1TB32_9STRA
MLANKLGTCMSPRAVPIDLATQYLGCWEDRSLNGAEDVLTNPDWDMGPFASVHVDPARYQDGVSHYMGIVGDDVLAFLVDFSRLPVDKDESLTAEGAAVSALVLRDGGHVTARSGLLWVAHLSLIFGFTAPSSRLAVPAPKELCCAPTDHDSLGFPIGSDATHHWAKASQ